MKITCLDTLESAWANAEDWRILARENPMHSPEWLLSWWKAFGGHNQLMVLQCQNATGEVVGIAPFYVEREFGSVAIHALGSGEVCSDYIRILSRDGLEKDVAIAVVEYLTDFCKRHSATQSTHISIEGVEADAPWLREFCEVTESRGYRHWLQPIMSSFRLKLPQSMDEYIGSLGDSAKRKGKRLLSKLRSGHVARHSTDEASEIPTRLAELRRLHQARRAMLGQAGCFSDPSFENFLSEAVELLAQRNLVRIDRCEVDGKTIATDLVLKGTDTLFMYQSGIDPDSMKLEPGHLLTIGSIQKAIELGFTYYDTLRGDEKYKTYWRSSEVPLATLHCCPPYLLSQVAGFSHFRFWQLKQVAKKFLATKPFSR